MPTDASTRAVALPDTRPCSRIRAFAGDSPRLSTTASDSRGGSGMTGEGLRLEIARAVAIEPALTEPEAATEDLFKHLSIHGADSSVGLGQFIVRARMLLQDGHPHAIAPCH